MALENVERFEKLLREDEDLQAQVSAASKAYEGEITDEAAFEALIAPVAAGVGLPFTLEEAREFVQRGRELSETELEAVAGGGVCYVIGGSTKPEANIEDNHIDGGACAYVGIGMFGWS